MAARWSLSIIPGHCEGSPASAKFKRDVAGQYQRVVSVRALWFAVVSELLPQPTALAETAMVRGNGEASQDCGKAAVITKLRGRGNQISRRPRGPMRRSAI